MNKERMLSKLIEKFNLAKGQLISYEKNEEISEVCFKDILNSLEEPMPEKELAVLLGINLQTFIKFRQGKHNARVLTKLEIPQKEKEEILEQIIIEFDLAKEQMISNAEFKDIYETVKSKFTEYELAQLLGIAKHNLNNIREKGIKTPVLKNRKYYKEDKTLLLELIKQYNLYREQTIYYKSEDLCFYQIYEPYKSYFTEMEMAKILGGTRDTYYKMKIEGLPFKVLKNIPLLKEFEEKSKNEIQKIKNENEGKTIDYKRFKKIYEKHKIYITEKQLALLLGINENMLLNMKKQKNNPIIKDYDAYQKCKILKHKMENRWYSLEEIEKICEENELEVNKFVKYIMRRRIRNLQKDIYLEALYINNGLYIGHKRMSNEFIIKNHEELKRIIFEITRALVKKYDYKFIQEDLISSGMEYIITNCGDIEENLKHNNDQLKGLIYTRARKYLNGVIVEIYKKNTKQVSTDKDFEKNYERKKRIQFLDRYRVNDNRLENKIEEIFIEEQLEKTTDNAEKIVNLFKSYLLQGYDKDIAMDNISNMFNIEKTEMLEIMKKYLLETGKVVQNKNGEYQIGEK